MARRVRAREEFQGPGMAGRPPRRRGGNEGLYIALGVAGVIGLVFLLVVSGGSGGESQKEEAKVVFGRFLKALIDGNEVLTMKQVGFPGILVEYGPELRKKWRGMEAKEKKRVRWEVYKWLQGKMKSQLRLESATSARRKVIDKSEIIWDSYSSYVQFRWTTEPYQKVIAERHMTVPAESWIARLSKSSGAWQVIKFGPEKRR